MFWLFPPAKNLMADCVQHEAQMKRSKTKSKKGHGKRTRNRLASPLSKRSQSALERVLDAISAMRRGVSLSRAARENGVTPRTIRRYAGTALVQERPGGRIRATKADRLVRY